MDEHRCLKISRRKHPLDVGQVRSNLIAGFAVLRVIGRNLDSAPIGKQPEMMSRLLMQKAHHVVTTLVHGFVVWILSNHPGAGQKQARRQSSFHVVRPFGKAAQSTFQAVPHAGLR